MLQPPLTDKEFLEFYRKLWGEEAYQKRYGDDKIGDSGENKSDGEDNSDGEDINDDEDDSNLERKTKKPKLE